MSERLRYYHGGPAGRRLMDWILPPSITGATSTQDVGPDSLRDAAARVHRRDRVYVTPNRFAALMFASGHRSPTVYEVVPDGELEPDPDCSDPSLSFACARAQVVRIERVSERDAATALLGMLASERTLDGAKERET